jgi:hypothetical protein
MLYKTPKGETTHALPPNNETSIELIILPVKTHYAIAQEYCVSPRTFRRWCKREGLVLPKGQLNPKYQRRVYETFGVPPIHPDLKR